jgi:hydroxymethylbilane synthase
MNANQNKIQLRIGTRGSPLALAQANMVRNLLIAAHDDLTLESIEINIIKTSGDRIQNRSLADVGGKGLFTKEIEEGLLAGTIDIAVHSMKDMPTVLPDGLVLPCLLEREDPRDAFISHKSTDLWALPEGAVVGTSSLRRGAQILNRRPDIKIVNFRGNVHTRLRKLKDGEVDATLLAMAGLNRLGMPEVVTSAIKTDDMLPAVSQGAVGIECRADDQAIHQLLAPLNHPDTAICVSAERALLAALDGSCRTPIAALAMLDGDKIALRGLIVSPDGTTVHKTEGGGVKADAVAVGHDAGEVLRLAGGADFFADL